MYHFIVNLKASSGKGKEIWKVVKRELKDQNIPNTLYLTKQRGHAKHLAKTLTTGLVEENKTIVLVVIGGDGTMNEVVNGLVDFTHTTVGYIPAGSGNDLARGLGIPRNPVEALEAITSKSKVIQMDVGLMSRNNKENRFLVSAGVGFDAAVCHQVQVSRVKYILNKVGLGKLTYVTIALDRIISDKPTKTQITLEDGTMKEYPETFFIAVMNTPFEGGGLQLVPDADWTDGKLDVIVVSEISRLSVIRLLPTAMKGKHIGNKAVEIHRVKKAIIHADKPITLHTDGEPLFLRKDMVVEVIPEKLNLIVGE